MKIWYDITNTPQVHFLLAVQNMVKEFDQTVHPIYTAREFSETAKMLSNVVGEDNYKSIGGHYGKSYIKKVLGLLLRFKSIYSEPINYDVSISCGSEAAIWKAKLEGKKSIAFGDNDQARQWTYGRFVNHAFFPNAIDKSVLERQGLKSKLYLYDGYKEDLYLANYLPNVEFLNTIPFDDYVVVRPENIMANYIRNGEVKSITPELLKSLTNMGINILYLPRYDKDKEYAKGIRNIFIPEGPINGLDACYYSNAVMTGAGTFAREAACLGVPSFSFFAGKELLSVDKKMINDGKMFFSRNHQELIDKMKVSSKSEPDLDRSIKVKNEVRDVLSDLLNTWK